MNPFSITVDYIEGQADGTIRVEVKTNNIILYQIPRNSLQNSSSLNSSALNLTDRDDLKKAGIYLLLNRERRTLYIGQADLRSNGDGVLNRMLEAHSDPEIDSWQIAFVLTSSTPSFLGATELNYLEKFFYDEAVKCGCYNLFNRLPPHSGEISPSTKKILNNYTEHAFFLLWHQFRCKIFIPRRSLYSTRTKTTTDGTSGKRAKKAKLPETIIGKTLCLNNPGKNVKATGVMTSVKAILVKADSAVSHENKLPNQKGQKPVADIRQKLIDNGVIVDFVFTQDHEFSSTSTAASVILGQSANGIEMWRGENGATLDSFRKASEPAN